ncbi:phosphoribosyltransferase family protein [Sphingobacterium mizutaii]|uniref:phosphoribosyltransferase family protein n=1 Tax=Sphingobacterium mizutaii TaxID=1010 RepID=UPI0028AEA0EE|nr:phosphoribosyltransferase family protein [Sphingobacterium mizutaii]
MIYSYSLHQILDPSNCTFSPSDYSLFKFGDTKFALKFAEELFNGFIQLNSELILAQTEIVLLPSPYYSIPTASNFLCKYFKDFLNEFLFQNGREACKESKIHRIQTYIEDYGNMNFEERINLISNDSYYLDEHFISNKFCIFLDDIKITGSHEKTINRILNKHNVKGKFFFIYYAELTNPKVHPNIENYFNYYRVKNEDDIIRIINSKWFCFNTRIIKYVLMLRSEKFEFILKSISPKKRKELFDLAISNNYHLIQEFQSNILKINQKQLWQLTSKKDKEKVLIHPNLQLG